LDAGGGEVVNESVITVAQAPTARLTVDPRGVTDVDLPLVLIANVTGGSQPGSSLWSFGDGTGATTATATHAWTEPGAYEALYTFTDRLGVASPTVSVPVQVNPELTAKFKLTPAASSPQVGTNFEFLAEPENGTAPYTAYWTFGDGSNAEGLEVNHSYARAGAYNITVIAVDSAGDAVSSSWEEVQIAPSSSHGTPLFGGGFGPSFALGLLVGAAVASVALFFAERSRRAGPPGPPSAYVPPAPVNRRNRD
jgi:PKD repeat protein